MSTIYILKKTFKWLLLCPIRITVMQQFLTIDTLKTDDTEKSLYYLVEGEDEENDTFISNL